MLEKLVLLTCLITKLELELKFIYIYIYIYKGVHELKQPTFSVKLVHLNSFFLKQLIHHFKAKTLFFHFRYSKVF